MDDENTNLKNEWWWDWGKDIVLDDSIIWEKKIFKPVAGFWILHDGHRMLKKISENEELPKDAIIENNAWDHEHCELCLEAIYDKQEGYTNDGTKWLCLECFAKYIAPRRGK